MNILVDSKILIRLANPADPQHQMALDATIKLRLAKDQFCMVPQNVYEFWTVATRPTNVNGLGLTALQADGQLAIFQTYFTLLDETPDFHAQWRKLVVTHSIVGKKSHDARLVAAMIVHGVTYLLTFNKQDFQRFTNITAMTPAEVLAMP